jgi:hypothetical protein
MKLLFNVIMRKTCHLERVLRAFQIAKFAERDSIRNILSPI